MKTLVFCFISTLYFSVILMLVGKWKQIDFFFFFLMCVTRRSTTAVRSTCQARNSCSNQQWQAEFAMGSSFLWEKSLLSPYIVKSWLATKKKSYMGKKKKRYKMNFLNHILKRHTRSVVAFSMHKWHLKKITHYSLKMCMSNAGFPIRYFPSFLQGCMDLFWTLKFCNFTRICLWIFMFHDLKM